MTAEKVSVLGLGYTVEFANLALESGEAGNCSPNTLTIKIDSGLPADLHNKTLLHELIHAALDALGQAGHYEDEPLVDGLALSLYQILRDCGALDMRCKLLKNPE